jgi:hypothetical protein
MREARARRGCDPDPGLGMDIAAVPSCGVEPLVRRVRREDPRIHAGRQLVGKRAQRNRPTTDVWRA